MDDRESKWKIEEYSSSKEDDDDDDDDDDDEDKASVVGQILTNGYVIGREIVITGIFISSAPLVVPSLVVVSAVGFAFTVPFGVLCASYACTNKLMSLFLRPTPPPMLLCTHELGKQDYESCKLGLVLDDYRELDVVEDYREDEDDYGVQVEEGYLSNKEVETDIVVHSADDYREEGDTLIANVDEDVDVQEREMEEDMLLKETDTKKKERQRMEDLKVGAEMRPSFDRAADDQGYEEDAGEHLQGDDDTVEEEQEALVENWNDENESAPEDAKLIDESASNVVFGDVMDVETTKPVTIASATNVVLEDVKDVGTTKPVTSESASNVIFGDVKDACRTISITSASAANVVSGDIKGVETTEPVASAGASNIVIGQVTDVGTTEPVTSESASNVAFRDVETAKPVTTSIGTSDLVFGDVKDVETNKPAVSLDASNVVFGDFKDPETTKPVRSDQRADRKFRLHDGGDDYRQLERDDDLVKEERKREELLVESPVGEKESNHEVNEDAKSRDEGTADNRVEDDQVVCESASDVVFGDDKDVEVTKALTIIEIESEKLVEKGSENDEAVDVLILSGGNDGNNYSSRVEDELDLVVREVIGDANKVERNMKADEEVVRGSMGTHEATGGDASNDRSEDAILRSMEEHLIHSNADARKIGEVNLLDERNTNNNLEVGNEVKENAADDNVKHATGNGSEVKENVADDNVDVLTSKCDMDNAEVTYKKMPSREENMDDEKIWEKIVAMRTIVGYKGPSQPTCIGELRALYVFTGVEPPASFEGDSDLDAKLKFLMAIVGVK